jgi:SRSO17 transposase
MACVMTCARTLLPQLGNQSAIVVIDETSFPKQGKHSAGVGVQYCGTTGQVENCQVGVFLYDKWNRKMVIDPVGTEADHQSFGLVNGLPPQHREE